MTAFILSHFPFVMTPAYQGAAGIGKDCKAIVVKMRSIFFYYIGNFSYINCVVVYSKDCRAIVAKMRSIFFYYSTFLLNDKTFFNLTFTDRFVSSDCIELHFGHVFQVFIVSDYIRL